MTFDEEYIEIGQNKQLFDISGSAKVWNIASNGMLKTALG